MLRKGITVLGEKWSEAYEKWLNGPATSFRMAHQRYLNLHMGRERLGSVHKKAKKDLE